ncbi:Protein disulfide-isomerase [Sparassis crispa]|uniref:Protein disulfide-isomerase n=1 Tax=Sparassis crispa TaxID=139825 RepID=A0A401GBD2_9APHY|nr:Protein disulfide-isomerase [Sparassis crispa]GBE79475.1 Protein disulfide-isomerase [Sparassis crispa]
MRYSNILLSATALILLPWALAEGASDVIDLTPANFESVVNPEPLVLVEFFAPWCGHCKALAPHYEEAATALKSKGIKLAKVNCVDEADLCQANGIQGYPTLRVYRNGEYSDYPGPRKADGIISYMIKQSLPAVTDVTSENYEEFVRADRIVALAFLPSSTDVPGPEFSATANKLRDDYLFGLTIDKAVFEAAGVQAPTVVLYRAFDEPKVEYPYPVGSVKVKDFEQWIKDLSIPIIDEVGSENFQTYAQSGKPLAYLFVDPSDANHDEYVAALKPIAAKYNGAVNFVWIDAVKYGDHAKALNLNEPKWPSFVIQDLKKQLKYPYDQSLDFNAEAIEEMVSQFVDGKLVPQLKSQPIPASQDESVFTLVSKQFDEVVYDDDKDVFVEFYASWCGHCKRLKPTWDSLGDRYADVKDRITIAKMESTENDLPPSVPFRVTGFPTLKFKKAGSRDFVDYDGDRSLESLVAFVEENAENPLDAKVPFKNVTPPEGQVPLQQQPDHHDEL